MRTPRPEIIERLREDFPVGCRVELLRMDDKQAPPILLVEVGMAEAVVNTTLINALVEVVRLVVVGVVNIGSSSDNTTVGSGCSD